MMFDWLRWKRALSMIPRPRRDFGFGRYHSSPRSGHEMLAMRFLSCGVGKWESTLKYMVKAAEVRVSPEAEVAFVGLLCSMNVCMSGPI